MEQNQQHVSQILNIFPLCLSHSAQSPFIPTKEIKSLNSHKGLFDAATSIGNASNAA